MIKLSLLKVAHTWPRDTHGLREQVTQGSDSFCNMKTGVSEAMLGNFWRKDGNSFFYVDP